MHPLNLCSKLILVPHCHYLYQLIQSTHLVILLYTCLGTTLPLPMPTPCVTLQVIDYLRSQQARQELLSMLYEVELRRHRETHRLFLAAEKQLTAWKEEGEKRNVSNLFVQCGPGKFIHCVFSRCGQIAKKSRLIHH